MIPINTPCGKNNSLEDCLQFNNQLKLLMDSSSSMFLLLDRDATLVWCNNAVLNLMGIEDVGQIIGKPLQNIYEKSQNEDFLKRDKERYHRLMSGEEWFVEDDVINWPMVGKRSYQITCRLLPNQDGGLDRILLVLNDVTDVQIKEAERRINDMLRSNLVPNMVWDEKGNVVAINKAALHIFGFSEDLPPEEYNKIVSDTHPEYQLDGKTTDVIRQEFIHEVLNTGFSRYNIQLHKIDGTPIYFGVSAARISWLSGYRLVVYYHDLTEIKAKEAKAKEAEERIKLMLDATPLCCSFLDEDINIIDCNEEAFKLFDLPDKQAYLDNFFKLSPEYQPDGALSQLKAKERIREAFEKGRIVFEWLHQKLNGELIPAEVTLVRVKRNNGYIVVGYTRDLREQKKMLSELREADERAHVMLDATPLACSMWDRNRKIIDCNQETIRLLKLSKESDYTGRFYDLQPEFQPDGELTANKAPRLLAAAFETGYQRFEWMSQTSDGEPLPFETTMVRVPWKGDYRVVNYSRDLREYKKMQAEANEANERIRLMLDSTPLICILWDEHCNIIDCNQEALNVLGLSQKSDLIENFSKLYPEFQPDGQKSIDKFNAYNQRLFEGEQNTFSFEWTFLTVDGELIPTEATLVRIMWNGIRGHLAYSRDLRETRKNEQLMQISLDRNRKLEIQKEKAQAASEAKSQFLASMSHEIRTPMNTIIGLLELMRTDNLDAEQMKYIDNIKHMSNILLEIINDILDFHKIESDKLELLPVHFNLSTFYNDMVSRHQFLAEAKHLEFNSSFAQDLPQFAFGDVLRMGQIVTNIIANAIKYTRRGHVNFYVDSTVEDGREFITFTVEDSGIGIKEENFAVLFDKFEQFDKYKNRGITGTGLGLPITKRLVDLMDGHIRFKSEYGKGSVFTVLLPLVKGAPDQVTHAKEIEKVVAKPEAKVLVVDDNAGNITVATGLLARHGIVPETAGNGIQAIEMIKTHRYDLVFMDHMMPEMDGVEATEIIRKLDDEYYRNLPIIALSANAVADAKELFINSGMSDFVSKPVRDRDFNRVLLRWLPAEKIAEKEIEPETSEQPTDETTLNKLLQELTKIKDISITSGLSRIGNDRKLYINILRQFCKDVDDDVNILKEYAQSSLWKPYAIRVHAIKSVLATVGNQFLSDWASRLEKAAMRGDTKKCMKENNNFCIALKKFYARILQTDLMVDVAADAKKQKITHKALKKKLETLHLACDDFQPETAEPIAKELLYVTLNAPMKLSTSVDTSLSEIHDFVYSFDYNKATEVIDKLLKFL